MTPLARRAQPWLGTMVEVGLVSCTGSYDTAFSAAFAAIRQVHQLMSPQHPASDIARFNAATAGAVIECDIWTWNLLAAARELGSASNGVFDVTLGSGGPEAWTLAPGQLLKHRDHTRLDLGGIAKGEAVDLACAAMRAAGVSAGWVNAGGDLRSFGEFDFPVHVRDADQPARAKPLVALREGAFATSDFSNGAHFRQVSIAAPQCRWADALTKIMALAPDTAEQLLPRYHAQAWTTAHSSRVPASQ